MEKLCGRCGETKPVAEFGRQRRTADGLRPYCRPCCSELSVTYQRKLRWRRRAMLVELKNVPCADCGVKYPYYVMHFDHVRGEKRFNISEQHMLKVNDSQLSAEIAKCDVVCSNCHAERTFQRRVAAGEGPTYGPLEMARPALLAECICGCGRPIKGGRRDAIYAGPGCAQRVWRKRNRPLGRS